MAERMKVLVSVLGGEIYAQPVKMVDGVPAVVDASAVHVGSVFRMPWPGRAADGWYADDIAHRLFGPVATRAKAIDGLLDWLDMEHATIQDTLRPLFP